MDRQYIVIRNYPSFVLTLESHHSLQQNKQRTFMDDKEIVMLPTIIAPIGISLHFLGIFNLPKLAPSKIKPAGMVIPPMKYQYPAMSEQGPQNKGDEPKKVAVSVIKDNGGFPSGA